MIKSQTASRLGISNIPTDEHLESLKLIAENVFEPLRAIASERRGKDTPLIISSGYRSEALNNAIGGSKTSQHSKGEALDIDIDGLYDDFTNTEIFYIIRDNIDFDQLIWEFGTDQKPDWVHVSYKKEGNRGQILKAKRVNGKVEYYLIKK